MGREGPRRPDTFRTSPPSIFQTCPVEGGNEGALRGTSRVPDFLARGVGLARGGPGNVSRRHRQRRARRGHRPSDTVPVRALKSALRARNPHVPSTPHCPGALAAQKHLGSTRHHERKLSLPAPWPAPPAATGAPVAPTALGSGNGRTSYLFHPLRDLLHESFRDSVAC